MRVKYYTYLSSHQTDYSPFHIFCSFIHVCQRTPYCVLL
uniref:Uncharacterized protein n=1 Tax=Anguilla anguilla TaxID=7936 RepID=A0A0E9VM56_ANGAN